MRAQTVQTWIARHLLVRRRLENVCTSYLLFLMVVTRKHSLEEAARFSGRHKSQCYRCSGLLLESYAACLSAKPLSSQYSPKRHNTVSECVAKYPSALSTEAVNTANSLKYWLWVARFFVFFHRYSIGL